MSFVWILVRLLVLTNNRNRNRKWNWLRDKLKWTTEKSSTNARQNGQTNQTNRPTKPIQSDHCIQQTNQATRRPTKPSSTSISSPSPSSSSSPSSFPALASTSSSTYHTSAVDLKVEKNIYRNGIDVAAFNGYWYNGFVADYFGCGTFNRPATIERTTLLPASHQPRSGIFNLKSSSKRAGQQKSNASFKNQKQSNWQNVNVIKRW